MFKKLFGNKDNVVEDTYETVDPIIEQRRMEKFSTPLIYNDEEEYNEEEKPVEEEVKKQVKEPEKKKTYVTKPVVEQVYKMSEIISPMNGVQTKKKTETKVVTPKVKVVKKEGHGLINIISPFYGDRYEEPVKKEIVKEKKEMISHEKTVEENLRNIKTIVEEEQDQLKIIEQRTGEFKLDFSTHEDSLIDEIDDSMSLDELMNLYEKKFKD